MEYNTDLFFAKIGKKKDYSTGYFVAWGVPSDLFYKHNRDEFEDKVFRETKGVCIPYDPNYLDHDRYYFSIYFFTNKPFKRMTVNLPTEDDKNIHHEMIDRFFSQKTPVTKSSSATKRNSSLSSIKKRLYSKDSEFTSTDTKQQIKRERSMFLKERARHDNDEDCYKNKLNKFVSIAEVYLSKNEAESEAVVDQLSPLTSVETVTSSSVSHNYQNRSGVLYFIEDIKLSIDEDEFIDSGRLLVILQKAIFAFQARDIKSILTEVYPTIVALQNQRTLNQITLLLIGFVKSLEL